MAKGVVVKRSAREGGASYRSAPEASTVEVWAPLHRRWIQVGVIFGTLMAAIPAGILWSMDRTDWLLHPRVGHAWGALLALGLLFLVGAAVSAINRAVFSLSNEVLEVRRRPRVRT